MHVLVSTIKNVNSCVHYFSIKSCVHICHARDKNIETITFGFTGLKKLHECVLNGLNSQFNDRMTSLPVSFQKFLLHQKIRHEISGGVSTAIFHLGLHLAGEITDLHP